jgi:hypothetical protein
MPRFNTVCLLFAQSRQSVKKALEEPLSVRDDPLVSLPGRLLLKESAREAEATCVRQPPGVTISGAETTETAVGWGKVK